MTDAAGTICPAGSYCPAGTNASLLCPYGTFGNATRLSSPACSDQCASGFECKPGSLNATAAPCPGFQSCKVLFSNASAACGQVYDQCNNRLVTCGIAPCPEPVVTSVGITGNASALRLSQPVVISIKLTVATLFPPGSDTWMALFQNTSLSASTFLDSPSVLAQLNSSVGRTVGQWTGLQAQAETPVAFASHQCAPYNFSSVPGTLSSLPLAVSDSPAVFACNDGSASGVPALTAQYTTLTTIRFTIPAALLEFNQTYTFVLNNHLLCNTASMPQLRGAGSIPPSCLQNTSTITFSTPPGSLIKPRMC